MARRTLNRKELRAQADAAERQADAAEDQADEAEDEEEAEDEDEDREEAEGDDEEGEDGPPKKKKPKAKPKAPKAPKATKPRKSRTAKITRMKVIWGVFNNSNQRVAAFEYPRRSDADALAAKLTTDKKSTHFVQPVKEPMEEKKEA